MASRNPSEREPSLAALLRLVDHAELAGDPTVQRLLAAATVTDSTAHRRQIERVLAAKAAQHLRQPFAEEPPVVSPLQDRLCLGVTSTGSTYAVAQTDLTQHLLAVGQSGSGKTTLFYNLMDQLTVPFWAFDLKQDYRHLMQQDETLLVLPWTELQFNPLKPPAGVPPRRWAQVFTEIFGHATALLSGSKNYVLTQLIDLYRHYNLFDEVSAPYPSLHELQLLMERDKLNYVRKTADYRDTVVNRLAAMNLTAGTIFDCSEGYALEDLLARNVVFEFDGLSRDLQNFVMEILFASVYEYRVAQNHRGGELRHVFFLDEGKQVFSVYKERQDAAGIPAIDELTAKMREFGEGLVVADQEATKLTDSIKANTKTKVLLATGDAKQFHELAGSMNLSARQADSAQTLGTGEAIVQVGNREPCPVRLTYVDLEKTMSDADLHGRQRQQWNELSATPRDLPATFQKQVRGADAATAATDIPTDPPRRIELSPDAQHLLIDVLEHPFKPLMQRYELLENAYQGNKAKTELVDAGVVVERRVRTGGKRTLLELTDRGRTYADTYLDVETQQRGRGGIVHRYWQYRLKELFEAAGWTAKREAFDADVYVNMGETELVVEVAMGNNEREIDHVRQHVETGFDAIWIVCKNRAVRDGLRKRLAESDLLHDRITFRLFSEISGEKKSGLP